MMKKIYAHVAGGIFLYTPFVGGKHPFIPSSKGNTPFPWENNLFIRVTPFLIRLPITFFFREGRRRKLRYSERSSRALVSSVVGFEPGSTDIVPQWPNYWTIQPCKRWTHNCQFIPTRYYMATYADWLPCNLIG